MKKSKVFESNNEPLIPNDKYHIVDILKGGEGDKIDDSKFDQEEFQVGCLVELEHTNNPLIAKEIATDHLSRISDYYHRLLAAGLVDEKDALDLAKSFGWN